MSSGPPFNPFPGLRPFRESEAHLFFGRGAQIDELIGKLGSSRFVAVVGASGSGKSSLVAAGLLPALHGGFSARVGSRWRIATFRPGANPIHNLARALVTADVLGAENADGVIAAAQVEATLRRSGFGLVDAAQRSPQVGADRLLIVVDQFEELFRFGATATGHTLDGDTARFVQLLIEATRHDAPIDVIMTMRSDFLGDCSQFRELPETINRGLYLVPRLTRGQLQEAITAPAAVAGVALSPRLVQRLLNDAGADPDLLPVVQHALMRTWDTWEREGGAVGPIDLPHYEACGGVESALSRHADEAYFGLDDQPRRSIAELMFKRITELGEDQRETRRPTSLTEIAGVVGVAPAELEEIIGHFGEQGRSFVTVSADGVVDISHESLIRQWPRLRTWVRQEVDSRDRYRRLADASERWGRGEAALLRDPDLQLTAQWWEDNHPTQAWAERYSPAFEPAARYLARSRRAARRRRAGAVAGVAVLAVLTVVSALLAVRADNERNRAESATVEARREQRTAVSRQLASTSVDAASTSRSFSILAALESVRATAADGFHLPVAEEAVRRAVRGPFGVKLPTAPVEVTSAAFGPDGSTLATGGVDGVVRLWDMADLDRDPQVVGDADGDGVDRLAFSPDGRWLGAASTDCGLGAGDVEDRCTVRLWDLADEGAPPARLAGHTQGITALVFSADGNWLATASLDGSARLWSLDNPGVERQPPMRHDGFVHSVAFSPDSARIITGGSDHLAKVWTVSDLAAEPIPLCCHADGVTALAFSPDGASVATGSADNTARVWDLTGERAPDVLQHQGRVTTVAFSADGAWLATGSRDATVLLWSRLGRGPSTPVVLRHTGAVEALVFRDDGRWLATGSTDSSARLFDLGDLGAEPVVLAGHDGPVVSLGYGAAGWLATASTDGTVRLWDTDHLATRPDVLVHPSAPGAEVVHVDALAYSPDGRWLATGGSDKSVRLWAADDLGAPPVLLPHPTVAGFPLAGITALAWSPNSQWLATGGGDRVVRLWDSDDPGASPIEMPGDRDHQQAVTSLAFSPDGRLLAAGLKDDVALVWNAEDRAAPAVVVAGHTDEVTSVAFSPDGRWLATGSRDGGIRLFAVDDLKASPRILEGHAEVAALAFSPDSRRLASGGSDATVRLWDVESGASEAVSQLPTGAAVNSVAYRPDGRLLIVAAGAMVQLWDVSVSDPATSIVNPVVLRDHSERVAAVAHHPGGGGFASGAEDGTARVWLPFEAVLELACANVGRNLSATEFATLFPGAPYRATCEQLPSNP